jgi:hypothetical protein
MARIRGGLVVVDVDMTLLPQAAVAGATLPSTPASPGISTSYDVVRDYLQSGGLLLCLCCVVCFSEVDVLCFCFLLATATHKRFTCSKTFENIGGHLVLQTHQYV